tara:strand:- start:1535 stop:1873 length:339 start_codon:yes stop_codon:yes gene_type:complete
MRPQSAKAKGRLFQQWVRDQLIEHREIHPEDIESRSMGAGGEDLIMARDARQKFPFSIECKNQEKLNVYEAYAQAQANSGDHEPVLFMKKNRKKALAVVDAEWFIKNVSSSN